MKVYNKDNFNFCYSNYCDYPVICSDYASREIYKNYSNQDVLFAFSKNSSEDTSQFAKNDLIGLSSIFISHEEKLIPKDFHNFYNCNETHRISYFNNNLNLIVHPGQITFFEKKELKSKMNLLATSNGDLNWIFIWDIYNSRKKKVIDFNDDDTPDYYLELGENFELENIRWKNKEDCLYSISYNQKTNVQYLCKYDFHNLDNSSTKSEKTIKSNRSKKSYKSNKSKKSYKSNNSSIIERCKEPVTKMETGKRIGYFCFSDIDENLIIATGEGEKFIMDLRDPKNFKYFGKVKDLKNYGKKNYDEILVEYNHHHNVVFLNRVSNNIEIYDVRNQNIPILQVESHGNVQKIEINPFDQNEFLILFEDYFAKINFKIMDYKVYSFEDKKISDISYSKIVKDEFLYSGNINKGDVHGYNGYLDISKF